MHKSTLHLYLKKKKERKIEQKSKPLSTYRSMYSEKNQHGDFSKLQKSVFSNQAHHTPHQTNILYEWYCLKTLEPWLFKVQSQQGNLRDVWNYIYTHTIIPMIFRRKTKLLMISWKQKHPKKKNKKLLTICAMQIICVSYPNCKLECHSDWWRKPQCWRMDFKK